MISLITDSFVDTESEKTFSIVLFPCIVHQDGSRAIQLTISFWDLILTIGLAWGSDEKE